MIQKIVLLSTLILLTACSQQTPVIDGQKNRFINKFFPAMIDPIYIEGDISKQKYPIIFLFDGYEGVWDNDIHIKKLQKMGYNVASIGYFDDAGYSNNLSKVNINAIKNVMDIYKQYHFVDTQSIIVLGRGKGAELALLLASYYPDIKMVVAISPSHVAFQASRATLATESSWVYKGKEVAFVPYPKFSWSALKSVYRVIVQNDDYRDLHDLAIEDKKAIEKARIKVENINGDIFLASVAEDKLWNSVLMGKEIIKRLKEKGFTHKYKHKSYKGKWFLSGEDAQKAWSDIYGFIANNLASKYIINMFAYIDKDKDKSLSLDEYLSYDQEQKEKESKTDAIDALYRCDTNHNQNVDFFEAQIVPLVTIYDINQEYSNAINMPRVENNCIVNQYNFKEYDLDSNRAISLDEMIRYLKPKDDSVVYSPSYHEIESYKKSSAKDRLTQCDQNDDNQIDKKEADSKKCQINTFVFKLADSNTNSFVSLEELTKIPTKYARFRAFLYKWEEDYNDVGLVYTSIYECDTNYDSKLDKAEAIIKSCGYTEEEFLESDVTKDGFFSKRDVKLRFKIEKFKNADKNSDGELSFFEWVYFL